LQRSGQTGCDGRVACWMAQEEADEEGDRHLGRLRPKKRPHPEGDRTLGWLRRSGTLGGNNGDVSYECWDQ
jgi:hypothetical protein